MRTIEYRTDDKTKWGPGPWQDEPDKVQFEDPATGLPCLIVRNRFGALCGYVGVSASHPWFGKDYSDIPDDVHGGLTFADKCQPGDERDAVCHLVEPGEDDNIWWLGFDCAHAFDFTPGLADMLGPGGTVPGERWEYKTIAYVKNEIQRLAQQCQAESPDPTSAGPGT